MTQSDDGFGRTLTEPGQADRPARPTMGGFPTTSRNRYEIVGSIGAGGMGRVFRAHDRVLGREVALKELTSHSPEVIGRFLAEARVTSQLQHPSIVAIYDAGQWRDDDPFYVMRLVEGVTLKEKIEQSDNVEERLRLLPIVERIVDATAFAHSKGVVHRDIKPSNIVVGEYGEAFLVDWGIAKRLSEDASAASADSPDAGKSPPERTAVGTVLGTPAYMPPEQAAGKSVDETADVYALGMTLLHVLTGNLPQSATKKAYNLSTLEKAVSADLLAIIVKAVAARPQDRYENASALAKDLRRLSEKRLVQARRYTLGQRLVRWASRNGAMVAVATAIVAGSGLALTSWTIGQSRLVAAAEKQLHSERLARAEFELNRDPTATLAILKTLTVQPSHSPRASLLAAGAAIRGVARHVVRGVPGNPQEVTFLPHPFDPWLLAAGRREASLVSWRKGVSVEPLLIDGQPLEQARVVPPDIVVGRTRRDGLVAVWPRQDSKFQRLKRTARVSTVANRENQPDPFTSSCAFVVKGHRDGAVTMWETPRLVARTYQLLDERIVRVLVSCDGKAVAAQGASGAVAWQLTESPQPPIKVAFPTALDHRSALTKYGLLVLQRQQASLWYSGEKTVLYEAKPGQGFTDLIVRGDLAYLELESGATVAWNLETGEQQASEERWSPPDRRAPCPNTDNDSRRCRSSDLRVSGILGHAVWMHDDDGGSWEFVGHGRPIVSVDSATSTKYVASLDVGGQLRLWDMTGPRSRYFHLGAPVPSGCDHPDLIRAEAADVWFVQTPEKLCLLANGTWREIPASGVPTAASLSADGSILLIPDRERFTLLDTATGANETRALEARLTAAAVGPDRGVAFATGSEVIVNRARGEQRFAVPGTEQLSTLALSRRHLVARSQSRLHVWDLESNEHWIAPTPARTGGCDVRIHAPGRTAATFCRGAHVVHVLDLQTRELTRYPTRRIVDAAFNVRFQILAVLSAGDATRVTLFAPESPQGVELTMPQTRSISWSLDQRELISHSFGGNLSSIPASRIATSDSAELSGTLALLTDAELEELEPVAFEPTRDDAPPASSHLADPKPGLRRISGETHPQPSLEVKKKMLAMGRTEARVEIEFCVLPNGTVSDAKVARASGFPAYDQALLGTVESWRYAPPDEGEDNCTATSFIYRQSQ